MNEVLIFLVNNSALNEAISYQNIEIVKLLLAKPNIDVNTYSILKTIIILYHF